jgi:hypothetical protein
MQPSDDPSAPVTRWVPMAEAVAILGLSESTIRRLIRRGRLIAENANLRERVWRAEALAASAAASVTILQHEVERLQARPSWRAWWPW